MLAIRRPTLEMIRRSKSVRVVKTRWRFGFKTASFYGNRDSDEILSDEDELDQVTYDNDCTKSLQSLCSNAKKVQLTLPVSSQLESLADKQKNPIVGSYEVNLKERKSSSSHVKLANISPDCMIGMHGIQDENHELFQPLASNENRSESADDSISDEENTVVSKLCITSWAAALQTSSPCHYESQTQYGACTWSAVIGEAKELATVSKRTGNCPVTSETSGVRQTHTVTTSATGDRGKARLKFAFRPFPHRGNPSEYTSLKDGNGKPYKDATEDPVLNNKLEIGTMENSLAEHWNQQKENDELLINVESHDQRGGVPSMAELLEDLQHKDGPSAGPPNLLPQNIKAKERKAQHARKKMLPHLGSRILDDEDPPEFSGGGLSSEDEDNDQNNLCVVTQKVEGHTMADLFQEAFSRWEAEGPPFPTSKQSGIGYHGRLQQVLQIEKDRQLEFLKHSQIGRRPSDNSGCVDVQILSRFLEAKLTVCQCLFGEYTNSSQLVKGTNKCATDGGIRKRTVIFSSKICDTVELEVGNFIRLHPPWKEVQVKEDEVFLCMYFSPVLAISSS